MQKTVAVFLLFRELPSSHVIEVLARKDDTRQADAKKYLGQPDALK